MMADRQAKWSGLMNDMELEELEKLVEETADEETLTRIRALALRKAGLDGAPRAAKAAKRRMKWPLRLLVAVLVLLGAMMTAFAATDLGYYLEDRFGEDFAFLSRLRVIGGYGSPVEAQATDQNITISVEAAYSDPSGTMLVLALKDEQGRLSERSELHGSFEMGGYQNCSWSTSIGVTQADGTVYALIDITSSEALKNRNTRYTVHWVAEEDRHVESVPLDVDIMEHVRIYREPAWEDDGTAPARAAEEGDMHIPVDALEGLVLTDLRVSEAGFSVYGYYPSLDENARKHSFSVSLCAPDGEIISADMQSGTGNDPNTRTAKIGFSAHFNEITSPQMLVGYTLVLSYFENAGKIYGDWPLEFRMPYDTSAKRMRIDRDVWMGEARYRIEDVMITPGAAIIGTTLLEGPSEQYVDSAGTNGRYPRNLLATLVNPKGDSLDEGSFSFHHQGNATRIIFTYSGSLEGASLLVTDTGTGEELLRVLLE